jgi:hypothetical protein
MIDKPTPWLAGNIFFHYIFSYCSYQYNMIYVLYEKQQKSAIFRTF